MNLYIYGLETDFTNTQKELLKSKFTHVEFMTEANYELAMRDNEPKVLALDPDITGWDLPNEVIAQIPNLKAICLQTSVAEKCVFMALALAKRFPLYLRNGGMSYAPEFIGDEMWDKPTDIIGFGEIGHALAHRLEGLVGNKEICYYSHNQNDPDFHYWPYEDMLEKSEFMFVTISKNPESIALFDDLSKFNKNMKVVIVSNGFEEVTQRLVEKCEAGELGGVAFESDDPEILHREYKTNIFVTPHNAHCSKEALAKMFEIWVDSMIAVADGKIINRVN